MLSRPVKRPYGAVARLLLPFLRQTQIPVAEEVALRGDLSAGIAARPQIFVVQPGEQAFSLCVSAAFLHELHPFVRKVGRNQPHSGMDEKSPAARGREAVDLAHQFRSVQFVVPAPKGQHPTAADIPVSHNVPAPDFCFIIFYLKNFPQNVKRFRLICPRLPPTGRGCGRISEPVRRKGTCGGQFF